MRWKCWKSLGQIKATSPGAHLLERSLCTRVWKGRRAKSGTQAVGSGSIRAKHSTQSMNWEQDMQEAVQPDDSQPSILSPLLSLGNQKSNHTGAGTVRVLSSETAMLARQVMSTAVVWPVKCGNQMLVCSVFSQGSVYLLHKTVIFYRSAQGIPRGNKLFFLNVSFLSVPLC